MGSMEGIKREMNEQQSDRAENHHQDWLYLGCFRCRKGDIFIENGLWLYSELCFLPERGAHFQKHREKSDQKEKNAGSKNIFGNGN